MILEIIDATRRARECHERFLYRVGCSHSEDIVEETELGEVVWRVFRFHILLRGSNDWIKLR